LSSSLPSLSVIGPPTQGRWCRSPLINSRCKHRVSGTALHRPCVDGSTTCQATACDYEVLGRKGDGAPHCQTRTKCWPAILGMHRLPGLQRNRQGMRSNKSVGYVGSDISDITDAFGYAGAALCYQGEPCASFFWLAFSDCPREDKILFAFVS